MRNLFVIATIAALSVPGVAFAQSTMGTGDSGMKTEGRATAPDAATGATGGAVDSAPGVNTGANSGAGHLGASGRMNGNANGNHMSGSNGQ